MRILALSDIHVDINQLGYCINGAEQVKFLDAFQEYLQNLGDIDVVIMAGDVSPSLPQLKDCLNLISSTVEADHYIYVPGNHDVWDVSNKPWENVKDGISREKYEKILPETVKKAKFRYLPKNPLIIDELGIIGTIGWYDYSFRNLKWDEYLKNKNIGYWTKTFEGMIWNDANYAEWGMNDLEVTKYLLNQLGEDFEKINSLPYKIVVMHHVPFKEGVLYKEEVSWDFFSTFMGASCFGDALKNWNSNLVIHGHTHFPQVYRVDPCKVYCVPIGYKHEWRPNEITKNFTNRIKEIKIDL